MSTGAVLEKNIRGIGQCPSNRGAEGAERGKVWGGVSPPQPTRSGERRELPAGSGAEPRPETQFGVF